MYKENHKEVYQQHLGEFINTWESLSAYGGIIMTIKEAIGTIVGRIDVLEGKCASAEKHNPDYYKSLKEIKYCAFIKQLMMYKYADEGNIGQEDEEWVNQLFTTKTRTTVEVHEGDNVLDLLDKYKDVKNVYNKIKKACEDNGLVMIGADVVRKS